MAKSNILLYLGAGVAAYMILKPSGTAITPGLLSTVTNAASNLLGPVATVPALTHSGPVYPYLVPGSPAIPAVFDKAYYLAYIRPAMVVANPNVNNSAYTLTDADCANYLANYLDLRQGLPTWLTIKEVNNVHVTSLNQACQIHWHIYGVPEQRTFLPLPWSTNIQYVPPPSNPASSGGTGIFSTLLKVATIAGGAAITIASGGTLAPIVAPATAAALTAESAIHGAPDAMTDEEIAILITSSAIIKKLLPFYLEVNPNLVASIENRIDTLVSQYAN